jgi:hypothetical protein
VTSVPERDVPERDDVVDRPSVTGPATNPGERWREVARRGFGPGYARSYAVRFAILEARGEEVDVDESMVEVARELRPDVAWIVSDLATFDLRGSLFDAAVLAGNVVPFLEPEALRDMAARLAAHLAPGGVVVTGFGLDSANLPPGAPVVPLPAYDGAMESAGFALVTRLGGWDGRPYVADGYAVSVHRTVGAETHGS